MGLQHIVDDPTAEADDRRTLAIRILHVVYVLGSLHALLLYPSLDSLAETGRVYES